MASAFSAAFVKRRKQAGFETAYQFYHKNGGRKALQCSFPNYLRIENGANLPKPARLPKLFALLRLPLGGAALRELVEAYLEASLGSRQLKDWAVAALTAPAQAPAAADPARRALANLVHDAGKPVSLAQFEALLATPARYWCFRVLTTSRDAHAAKELARLLGLSLSATTAALRALGAARLARRAKDGRWFSPLAGQFLVFPDSQHIPAALRDKAFAYNRAMAAKRGKLVDVRYCGVRADAAQLEGFVPYFREAIRGVNAYAVTEKTERSGLFFVEGRIYKLLDF